MKLKHFLLIIMALSLITIGSSQEIPQLQHGELEIDKSIPSVSFKSDEIETTTISGGIDTNASTECTGDEFLLGNSTCTSLASLGIGTVDTNATTECTGAEVLLGNSTCSPIAPFLTGGGGGQISNASIAAEYLNLSGTNADQDINISSNDLELRNLFFTGNLSSDNFSISMISSNDFIKGVVFGILFDEGGELFPHIGFQPGGAGQGSFIARSLIIADDNHTILGTTNRTDCQSWVESVGTTLEIDCNTTASDNPLGTGADLLLLGDFQVLGEIKLRDTDLEWHDFSRELQLLDQFFSNVTSSPINGTFNGSELIITSIFDDFIAINIDRNEKILEQKTDSIVLTSGTNATPTFNEIFYTNRDAPVLDTQTTFSEKLPRVGGFLLGDDGFNYGSFVGGSTNREALQGIYNRFLDEGSRYKSGFDIEANSGALNISTGTMKVLLTNFDITSTHSTSGLVVEIHNDGEFHQHINNLTGFDTYSTDEAISLNKFFNLVCGITPTHDMEGVMYCVVQDKPSSEHNTLPEAENDNVFVNIFPNHEIIKKVYIPIVRVVLKATPTGNEIQTLSTGNLFFDLRGTIVSGGGSPPTPGITSHPQLTNLGFSVAGHTGFLADDGSIPLTANWIPGDFWIHELLGLNATQANITTLFVKTITSDDWSNVTADWDLLLNVPVGFPNDTLQASLDGINTTANLQKILNGTYAFLGSENITINSTLAILWTGAVGASADFTNIAYLNNSQAFTEQQNFTKNISIDNSILDPSGNILLQFIPKAGSVDYITIRNSPMPNGDQGPIIGVGGTTSNIDLVLEAKGTGWIRLKNNTLLETNRQLFFRDTSLNISSINDGELAIKADVSVNMTSPVVDISSNITINEKLCFTTDCEHYMWYNGSSIIIQG